MENISIPKTDGDWLALAIEFYIGKSKKYYYNCTPELGVDINISRKDQIDGSIKWAVKLNQYCLGKDNEYYHEPLPSARSDEFFAMCRFDTRKEAFEALVKNESTPKKTNDWIDCKYI